ncbi:membrane glycoprotein US11 [Cercopithecine betaherpesvirus 5]|uniref:Membrane glycoprotein US11 n=1 Tax=Simian cytomegalovirus (strain Colburn) TaxID=50292 RepID=G8XU50_SCMVC|nr:membrane glycoprotein US11 [Cercopithecine betaherpesvirus 5]
MKLASVCLLFWTLDHLCRSSDGHGLRSFYFAGEVTEDDIEYLKMFGIRFEPVAFSLMPIKKDNFQDGDTVINVHDTNTIVGDTSPTYIVKGKKFPPSNYRVENLEAQCRLKNSHKLEILWTYSGNISEDSYVNAVWYHGNIFGRLTNLQNVSTESQHRYYVSTEEVHKYMDVVYFDVFPCKQCRYETVKCEPKIEVSWLPLWTSISDIDRLVYEGRYVLAFWALLVKCSQWAAMILVLFEIHRDLTRGIRWPWQVEQPQ